MSKEKELVNGLRQWFDFLDSDIDVINITRPDVKRVISKALTLYEKMLSLPKRTLETLEEGDWVEVKFLDAFLCEAHDFPEVLQGVVNVVHTWLGVGGWEFDYNDILDITIIPLEALELLKEVVENE